MNERPSERNAIPFYASLHGRFLIVLLGLTALPALAIGGLALLNGRESIERNVEARLNAVADLKREEITTWLDTTEADARLLANNFLNEEHFTEILDPGTDPRRREDFSGFLTDNMVSVQKSRAGYAEIVMVDLSGTAVLSTDPEGVGRDLSDAQVVQGTFDSPDGTYIQDIHRSPLSGEIEMAFGHILHTVDLETFEELPEVNGAVVIRVRMDATIYSFIQELPERGMTGETLLIREDGAGTLFLNPLRFDQDATLNLWVPVDSPNAKPAHFSSRGADGIIRTPDYRGVEVLAAYRAIPKMNWGLVAKQDLSEAFAPILVLTRQWLIGTAIILLLAVIVAVLLARALVDPLNRLVTATRSIAAGAYETDLEIVRSDEIGVLGEAFSSMVAALRFRQQQLQLVDDAALSIVGNLSVDDSLQKFVETTRSLIGVRYAALQVHHDANGRPTRYTSGSLSKPRDPAPRPNGRAINAPIVIGDRTLGELIASEKKDGTGFRRSETELLSRLAAHVAVLLENSRLFSDLNESYDRTLDALVAALDTRDKETEGHTQRVVSYTLRLAQEMDVPVEEMSELRRGALLHDIGKIGVPDRILHKPGPLTEDEWVVMRMHPVWGENILRGISFLKAPARIVASHHERWDGDGYPKGLAGEQIPLGARIFAVADTLDAITSDRPYRAARPFEVARSEIEAGDGSQFDPRVVAAFRRVPETEWGLIRRSTLAAREDGASLSPPEQILADIAPELETLNRMITAVRSTLELQKVLDAASRAVVDTLGAAASALFLYTEGEDELKLAALTNLPDDFWNRFGTIPVMTFHNESVIRKKRLRLIDDLKKVAAFVELGLTDLKPRLGQYLCVPLLANGQIAGLMGIFSRQPKRFEMTDLRLYGALGEHIGLAISHAQLHESIRKESMLDSLTRVFNRRYMKQHLAQEMNRSARHSHSFALFMIDIDGFKRYNDRFGHPAGDRALIEFTEVLRKSLRASDTIVRYGGDEFVVILPETGPEGAASAARKLLGAIREHPFPHTRLSVSIGACICSPPFPEDADASWVITRADRALYQAKREGGNAYFLSE